MPRMNILFNLCATGPTFHLANNPSLSLKQKEFLQKFDSNWEYNDDSDIEEMEDSAHQPKAEETKQEFENKKGQLLLLLDQAQLSKMKISKAFPEKLAKFGPNLERFGLNWHPGWREPERFTPELDCDPYRGGCSNSSCMCEMFETWPKDFSAGAAVYVYNPNTTNPETELCKNCYHSKMEHTLATKKDRNQLKEFSRENMDKYSIQTNPSVPRKHPADIPQFELKQFYDKNPEHPGATENAIKKSLLSLEGDNASKKKGLADLSGDATDGLGDDDEDDLNSIV